MLLPISGAPKTLATPLPSNLRLSVSSLQCQLSRLQHSHLSSSALLLLLPDCIYKQAKFNGIDKNPNVQRSWMSEVHFKKADALKGLSPMARKGALAEFALESRPSTSISGIMCEKGKIVYGIIFSLCCVLWIHSILCRVYWSYGLSQRCLEESLFAHVLWRGDYIAQFVDLRQ